ncbi:glycosyltransferase family protein [Pedobacter rhizosphaerae]|uniref:Glycosyl transferase family 8 n=1 Tax=Pedobacter rhizosphaerae TaxID=390241 RepID=A0A1H9U3W2_9SPHI|nr:hypothetical protein [Pedobacter rhizosphaerae]SES03918.1 hypothetical protein SAMN04488023_12714 [Pedobacter rhizosphaerae]
MKHIAFTICAKNYVGLAQVLEKSLKHHHPEVEFFILVADEFDQSDSAYGLPNNAFVAREVLGINDDLWNEMSFKYDLTEFCTSIKPSCFKFLFRNFEPDTCIYFDPDILVFNSLDSILEILREKHILLTPHITTIETNYSGNLAESGFLFTGMFNLGFLGLKRGDVANNMLDWWDKRLEDRCFVNRMENFFTDQKWMDFLPSFFPNEIHISQDLGLNFAPWNFYERKLIQYDNMLHVQNRIRGEETNDSLKFVHFSGFNYNALLNDEVKQGNIPNLEIFPDLQNIFDTYSTVLKDSTLKDFIQLNYSYNYFSDGTPISKTYRKLYRRWKEDGMVKDNPFLSTGKLFTTLKKQKVLVENLASSDKSTVANVGGVERKLILVNKFLALGFKLLGANRFFMLVRLLRLYSKVENHLYLLDKSYLREPKIRD